MRVRKGTSAGTIAVLLLVLLLCSSCGRKAKPEPKWGGAGTVLPPPVSHVASLPGTSER